MQPSKVAVSLFLLIFKHSKEERPAGKERGGEMGGKREDRREREGERGEAEERKGDENTCLGCYSCNAVEKGKAGFKVTHGFLIFITMFNCGFPFYSFC